MSNPSIGRVRGKFKVNAIRRHMGSKPNPDRVKGGWIPAEMHTVEMSPVMGGSPEDAEYSEATPAGSISLSVTKADVVGFFDLDQTYYVDFTPAT